MYLISRADGGEFADKVYKYFRDNSQDVFTDVNNIRAGDAWSKTIEENISTSDIFIVILTFAALSEWRGRKRGITCTEEREKKLFLLSTEILDLMKYRGV